jgi:hypothetical protein
VRPGSRSPTPQLEEARAGWNLPRTVGSTSAPFGFSFSEAGPTDTLLVWWLQVKLIGLPLADISTVRARMPRAPGVLLLAMGTFGWAYYATDSGSILEARTAHVGFGGLLSLGWTALGLVLLKRRFP